MVFAATGLWGLAPTFCCIRMTGRLWSKKTPIMPIGIVVTLVIISGCRLAGIPGEISVSPPAESLPISGGNEVIGTEIVGELDTSTEDSTATEEVLPDASMDEEQILEIATVLPIGGPPGLAEFAQLIAEGVEIAAVELSEPLLDVRITSLDDQGDPALTGLSLIHI